MNILFLGSHELLARINKQIIGQSWDIHHAADPDHILDFEGTHAFQAALVGLCAEDRTICAAANKAKSVLNAPVVVGLASQDQAVQLCEKSLSALDIIVPECGNDSLTKLQCDAIVRLANGARSEIVSCGGLSYHISDGKFSVNGRDIHLPQKKHKLLELLFLKRGRIVTKEMVFNHLYGWDEPPEAKIIDVFVCLIRRTLREAGLGNNCIETVWGQGYRIPNDASFKDSLVA